MSPEASGSGPSNLDELFRLLWEWRGTDLHLSAGMVPRVRVDGELRTVPGMGALGAPEVDTLAASLLTSRQRDDVMAGRDVDFSFGWRRQARIRGNAFRQQNSLALALRLMPHEIPSFDELAMPQSVRNFAVLNQGLVLVTGPTGSGKSSTLAALVGWIGRNRPVHVITIEDPIEYVHEHSVAIVHQRAVGEDAESFAGALRSALREDPDVLMVGELRDLESIRFAVTLAETGHLVFGTVHTNDTAQTVDRIVEVFPGDEQAQIRTQVAMSLAGVVYQRLLPRIGGGLIAAYEVMVINVPLRNLIRQGRTDQMRNQMLMGQAEGMMTIEQSLSALVAAGIVSYEEAVARARHPSDVTPPQRREPPKLPGQAPVLPGR